MAPQFMMSLWVVLDDLVERPRYRGVMCWMMGVSFAMSLWVVLDDGCVVRDVVVGRAG